MLSAQQEKAFAKLLNRNNQVINKVCWLRCGGNAFYFDELREQCYIELWLEFSRHGISRFRNESKESTWVYKISHHAIEHYLRNPNHSELPPTESQHYIEQLASYDEPDIHQLLDELTLQMSDKEQTLLDHYLNNLSYAEIAKQEDISETTARKRMSRLMKRLRTLIHQLYH